MCSVDTSLLQEHLRTNLLNEGSVFTQILVPLVSVALHDHNRYSKSSSNGVCSATSTTQTDSSFQHHHQEFTIVLGQRCAKIMKENLNVTKDEREKIEETTRSQSKSSEWFAARAWRITGSTCGKILCQKDRTDALLMSGDVLQANECAATTNWGLENEKKACGEYVRFILWIYHT